MAAFTNAEIVKMLNTLSKRIYAVESRQCQFAEMLNERQQSDIDYIALMTDVDLDEGNEEEVPEEEVEE